MNYRAIARQLLSAALDTAGGVCKTLGSSCSLLGGAGLVSYYAMKDEKMDVLYYGEETSQARFNAQAGIRELNYLNPMGFSIPHHLDKYGEKTIPFAKILNFEDIKIYSIALICGGAVLNSLGHLIQTWTQGNDDRKMLLEREARDIGMPSFSDYKYVLIGSVCASVSQMLMSAGLVGTYMEMGKFFNTTHGFTYPAESDQNMTYSGHTLLLDTKTYNLSRQYFYDDKIGLPFAKWPGVPNAINLQFMLNVAANLTLTYGAGLFYKPDPKVMFFPMALVPGSLSGYARHFFANKAEHLRQERLLDRDEDSQSIEMTAISSFD